MTMKTLLVAALFWYPAMAIAEDSPTAKEAVLQVIEDFFAALTLRDVERMQSIMTPDGIIYGYRQDPEGLRIIRPSHASYLANLASGEAHIVERFWDPQVMVYERLATVWTPYDFYTDGEFSHCGVNNFSLLRTEAGWVIAGVVFSIESSGCAESPLGPYVGE